MNTALTPETLAELRRLAEAATPGPWHAATGAALQTDAGDDATHVWYCRWRDERFLSIGKVLDNELDQTTPEDAAYIAAANPAVVLALLDAAAERDALAAAVERVRALHYAANNDTRRTPVCEDCHGKAGVHECGCWAERDREPVCGHCNEGHKGMSVPWPCPTILALDGGES